VLIALLAVAIFIGLIAFVVRISGRRFPGDITGDRHRQVNYDDPYQGYTFRSNTRSVPVSDDDGDDGAAPKPTDADFEQWETDHWPGHER
jgi:hypothetical protein